MEYSHTPVLVNEVIEFLNPKAGDVVIDCTLGGGGYSFKLAERVGPKGKVIAIDADILAINNAKKIIVKTKTKNIKLIHDNFKNLYKIYQSHYPETAGKKVSGIAFDLGLSSAQLQDGNRGFSFRLDAPLDMRFAYTPIDTDKKRIKTDNETEYIVNKWPEKKIAELIFQFGEERHSRYIAKSIVQARKHKPIRTTNELVNIIKVAVPKNYQNGRIHFATRTFQALRIATNREMENLETALSQAIEILAPRGRVAVVSYHSLEDRIVKRLFKKASIDCICPPEMPVCRCHHQAQVKIVTKKIVTPNTEEVRQNPRARSARLRVAEKI